MDPLIGAPLARVDGPKKAAGRTKYAADFAPPDLAYAVMIQSTVASGRIAGIDTRVAEAMPGVLLILTHRNAPALPDRGVLPVEPPAARVLSLLQDDAVHYNGEPIGVVVAERWEQAVAAAANIGVTYTRSAAQLDFDRAKAAATRPAKLMPGIPDRSWGDIEHGLKSADVRMERTYTTPMEHHNPIEPHATTAQWEGDHLTLYDATQHISGVRETVARVLGLEQRQVRIVCPFVGGGFGGKGSPWSHVVLAAMAARMAGRPVRLALAREQMFGPVGGRPQTEQRITLGAQRDGQLTAVRHEVISHTAVMEEYVELATQPTQSLYACGHGSTTQRLAKLNVGVPTFQRAPGEATGTFALESAMDELAVELGIDPLELRLRNHAEREPATGNRWSSKRLKECYRVGAERFDWPRRDPRPQSMREGSWLVGWGLATATYPAHREPAAATARALRDGTVLVRSGTQDLGTGTYTVMTQIAADALGLPIEAIRFELGDSALPAAPISGGSMTVASVGPAVRAACRRLRELLAERAAQDPDSPLHGLDPKRIAIRQGRIEGNARGEMLSAMLARQRTEIEALGEVSADDEERFACRSFGAVFVEVRVHRSLLAIRVPRVVAAYSVGRVLNARTARSQLQGGIVWGIGMALFERSILDRSSGRFVNANLAEYHVPVNADIGTIDTIVVDESDSDFNALGARGIGEIGITGVAAAVANAVYHATGRRIRALPITPDTLF